jgi:hypothetical protein
MSADNENELAELQARIGSQSEIAGAEGEAWVKRLEPEFAKLPKLTYVVINCRTGEYVTGATLLEAADEFVRRFANDKGYAHQVGGGFYVGWGGGIV